MSLKSVVGRCFDVYFPGLANVNIVIGSKTSLMVCSMEFLLFKKKEWHFQSLKVPNLTGFQTFLGPEPRCGAHHIPQTSASYVCVPKSYLSLSS